MSDLSTLYTDEILRYSKSIFCEGALTNWNARGSAHSKICGSSIHVTLQVRSGVVVAYGQTVKACALGRAAASMVGEAIVGSTTRQIEEVSGIMRAMLAGLPEKPGGKWSRLALLDTAKDFRSRHGSILLVFDALMVALNKGPLKQVPERSPGGTAACS